MSDIVKIGVAEIRVTERQLWIAGVQAPLIGRAFDLLVALTRQPGRVISKDDLLTEVWGDKPIGDFNLHVQISRLRKLVGAESIRTVPGRGYCFLPAPENSAPGADPQHHAAGMRLHAIALFGRDQDVAAIKALLDQHRLVVVTGAGGVGKTTVGQIVLERDRMQRRDGAAWVDLTAVGESQGLSAAVAAALKLSIGSGQPLESLVTAVRPLQVTVLLDNADALADGVDTLVQQLLINCPDLRFLVTSQVQLKHRSARHYRLEPLACPPDGAELDQALDYPAVALLQDRIQAANGHFQLQGGELAAAVGICRQLDGIPLAIELVAVRCATLGLLAVLARLSERFRWTQGPGAVAAQRHQTPRSIMAWSYELLTEVDRRAFRRLGVCVGGFSLALARLLIGDDDSSSGDDRLADLVDHSLAVTDAVRPGHYRLLETGRLYALDRLSAAGEECDAYQAHACAVQQLFESAYTDFWRLPEPDYVARYEPDLDNLRAALTWTLAHDPQAAIALAGASGPLWRCLSLHHEGAQLLERAAERIDDATPKSRAARLWESIAVQYGESASVDGREPARRAARLYQELGDLRGRYLSLAHLAYSFRYIDGSEAQAALEELRRIEDPEWPASVRLFGARIESARDTLPGRIREGRAVNELRLALAMQTGSRYEANCALVNLADLALTAGDIEEAVRLNRDLLQQLSRRHMASRIIALGNLLEALVLGAWVSEARAPARQFLEEARQLDFMFGMFAADALGLLAADEGRWSAAAHLLGYADFTYAARHRERGPNELAVREQLWSAVQREVPAGTLEAWMERGATMSAEAVCLLALNSAGSI